MVITVWHCDCHDVLGIRHVGAHGVCRNSQHEHIVGLVEIHLVGSGVVEQHEITGAEPGLTTILDVEAAAGQLQLQKEQRVPRPSDVLAAVVHDGRIRVHQAEPNPVH